MWACRFRARVPCLLNLEVLSPVGVASASSEAVSTVRRIAQRKLEEELEYVETDSVYSYRL